MTDYSNIESSTDIKTLLTSISKNYSHEHLEEKVVFLFLYSTWTIRLLKVSIIDESANPWAHYFSTYQFHSTLILLYTEDGDKYTGIWDNRWKGKGEINYKDGKKYIGQWNSFSLFSINLKRHGLGILYSADGQVLNQGNWEKDEYKGKE